MNRYSFVVFLLVTWVGFYAFSGLTLEIKGQVLRVENNIAIISSKSGVNKIPLKRLSKEQIKLIQTESGSKKQITLRLPAQALEP
mgnify:CR=1 FL=1